jgi:hypothetical protein
VQKVQKKFFVVICVFIRDSVPRSLRKKNKHISPYRPSIEWTMFGWLIPNTPWARLLLSDFFGELVVEKSELWDPIAQPRSMLWKPDREHSIGTWECSKTWGKVRIQYYWGKKILSITTKNREKSCFSGFFFFSGGYLKSNVGTIYSPWGV